MEILLIFDRKKNKAKIWLYLINNVLKTACSSAQMSDVMNRIKTQVICCFLGTKHEIHTYLFKKTKKFMNQLQF